MIQLSATDFTQLSGIVEMDSTYFNKSFKVILYRQIKRRKHNQLKFFGFRNKNVVIK